MYLHLQIQNKKYQRVEKITKAAVSSFVLSQNDENYVPQDEKTAGGIYYTINQKAEQE